MSRDAHLQHQRLRVVVASPGDVAAERDLVDQVAAELNRGLAAELGLQIEVARWETDAFPGFHAEGPQGLVDSVLRIQDCELLIGIFWKRFGTPVSGGQSGTEHEFKEAYNAWRSSGRPQIMMYFNRKAYSPTSKEELDQWSRVLEFRQNFPKEGLWWPYNGSRQFEQLLRSHMTLFIRRWAVGPSSQWLQGFESAASDFGERGYQLLPVINRQVQKIVEAIVAPGLKRSWGPRAGCRELFALYVALDRLATSSERFVDSLERVGSPDGISTLAARHEVLTDEFVNFAKAARKCKGQLSIYNRTLSHAIWEVIGSKGERLQYWLAIFSAASREIRSSMALADLHEITTKEYRDHFDYSDKSLPKLQSLLSLDDTAAVAEAAADGRDRIAALRSVANTLADFIRQNCEFSDLFPDHTNSEETRTR